ncbi:MAG TPA: hypothetical protein VGJ88_08170 [Thermoanaerobaculia bacterium]|jgi:hypothetical protein
MYAQKRPIENAHIVRERDRRRFRELLAVLSLGIPIGAFLLLFTWQNLEVIRLGREATHLQDQRKQIEDANKSLQLELDRLTALDAVENKARSLGFEPADPRAVVTVTPSPSPSARGWREAPGEGRASP